MIQADIVVIGAGAAGLIAAKELSREGKKIIVLEARERIGGRINTIHEAGFSMPVEGGAEFVHGKLPLTLQLLKEANATYTPIGGEVWQHKHGEFYQQEGFLDNGEIIAQKLGELEGDMSVNDFLNTRFADDKYAGLRQDIRRFVEGYDAADVNRASVAAMAGEFAEQEEEQYRIRDGYSAAIKYLQDECKKQGCEIKLSIPVQEVKWSKGNVELTAADGEVYTAKQVLITIPIGLLQAPDSQPNALKFTPAIPEKLAAARAIGFGPVIKCSLEFREPFWTKPVQNMDLSKIGFLFSEAKIPTWWTRAPETSNLLTGWLAGPNTKELAGACDEELLKNALHSLAVIFNKTEHDLRKELVAWHIANWVNEPYTLGAYTYATVGGQQACQELMQPVNDTIFFAGEGVYIGPDTGTVEAALYSGLEASRKMLQANIAKTATD